MIVASRAARRGRPGDGVAGSTLRERVILGWAGLRGAVPVVLATFPVIDGVSHSHRVLQHRLLRGPALDDRAGHDVRAVARWLGVTTTEAALPRR